MQGRRRTICMSRRQSAAAQNSPGKQTYGHRSTITGSSSVRPERGGVQSLLFGLAKALGIGPTPGTWRRRLPSVQHIIVHIVDALPLLLPGQELQPRGFLKSYDVFTQRCAEEQNVPVLAMSRPQSFASESDWKSRLYQEWLGRITGGKGCWVGSEEEEKMAESHCSELSM